MTDPKPHEGDIAKRTQTYYIQLQEFREIQGLVALPSFNIDHHPELYKRFVYLSERLKNEADALWDLGINVY